MYKQIVWWFIGNMSQARAVDIHGYRAAFVKVIVCVRMVNNIDIEYLILYRCKQQIIHLNLIIFVRKN